MTVNAEPLLDASQIAANAAAIAAINGVLGPHVADTSIHFADAPADANSYVRNNNAWVLETVQAFGEYRGVFDASIGTFPVTTNAGDWFNCTVAGTVDGQAFIIGDILVALIDAPSTTTFAGNWSIVPNISVTDHTLLTNIGVNTHAQIDTHIADGSVHFTEASIDHAAILNIGVNTHAAIDAHLASSANPHGVNVQQAYVATGGVPHIVLVAGQPFTIRDNAAPIGNMVVLENGAGVGFFDIDPLEMNFGQTLTDRIWRAFDVVDGYGGVEFYPDGRTRTDAGFNPAFIWQSTVNSIVPGGGGIGNDTAPNFVNWSGEIVLTEQGNLFNTQSLFSQSTTVTCEGANTGPIYTMINQPIFRTGALGGSRTGSQQNAVRSQMRIGPNLAGNFLLTSHETYFATVFVDATVGTASITTVNYFAPKAPGLTAGGTIGTLNVLDIPNIPAAGITTLRGINSAMSAGLFINHTAAAESTLAGHFHLNDNILLKLGATNAAADIGIGWDTAQSALLISAALGVGANPLYLRPTAADEWTFEQDDGGALDIGLGFNVNAIVFGTTAPTPNDNNWFVQFAAPNLRAVQVAGEYSDILWTAGGSIDIAGFAMSDVNAFKINSIATILNGGSIADSSTLFVSAMASTNATRVQALRVLGRTRIDGRVNLGSESPAQIVANQNNYQLAANNSQRTMVRLDSSDEFAITGIDSAFGRAQNGDSVRLVNIGAFNITLTDEDAASLAANRFHSSNGNDVVLRPDETVEIWYDDGGTDRWRILERVPGAALISGEWSFDTATGAADPGAGNLRYNNATPASVTAVYVDQFTDNGADAQNILAALASGDQIYIQQSGVAGNFLVLAVTSVVDNTGWFTINGTISASGSLPGNNRTVLFSARFA